MLSLGRLRPLWLALALVATLPPAGAVAGDEAGARCMALVAYAEAAGEGPVGMAAVMHVIRNRVRDPRFPDHPCAVVLQHRQFQPVMERPQLRRILHDPVAYAPPDGLGGGGVGRAARLDAVLGMARALIAGERPTPDPSRGALYFVNPALMDQRHCRWFAGLKRTAVIGSHVFMTHYRPGEAPGPPALDCQDLLGETAIAELPPAPDLGVPEAPADLAATSPSIVARLVPLSDTSDAGRPGGQPPGPVAPVALAEAPVAAEPEASVQPAAVPGRARRLGETGQAVPSRAGALPQKGRVAIAAAPGSAARIGTAGAGKLRSGILLAAAEDGVATSQGGRVGQVLRTR